MNEPPLASSATGAPAHATDSHPSARHDAPAELPVLWHLEVSNYNEKARWALDFKRIEHIRRPVVPGRHVKVAGKLTGGTTFPVLVIDGRALGDSSDIIAELERRWPDPCLYPRDPDQRQRALELEDFFDEQLGPWARLLFLHHVLPDPPLMLGAFVPGLRAHRRLLARLAYPIIRRQVVKQFGITPARVWTGFDRLSEVGERFRAELGGGRYLVGDSFTVADLTAASLVAPLVAPEQFPYPQPQRNHPRLEPLREALAEAGMLEWVREMYARHRGTSAEARRSTLS